MVNSDGSDPPLQFAIGWSTAPACCCWYRTVLQCHGYTAAICLLVEFLKFELHDEESMVQVSVGCRDIILVGRSAHGCTTTLGHPASE